MNGVPFHPLVVHFPVVLVTLLPIFALGALWAMRRGASSRVWLLPLAFAAALAASSFVAVRTGEAQEDTVEAVVSEAAMERHEEAGERFMALSAILLLVTGAGLLRGSPGIAGRALATAGAIALLILGVSVGHSGGGLVYVENAASAYGSAQADRDDAAPDVFARRDRDDGRRGDEQED